MALVLFIVEKPQSADEEVSADWDAFLLSLANVAPPPKSSAQLADDVWLLDTKTSLLTFSGLLGAAKRNQIPFRTLLLDIDTADLGNSRATRNPGDVQPECLPSLPRTLPVRDDGDLLPARAID